MADRTESRRRTEGPVHPARISVKDQHEIIDLECEGLLGVTAKWHPREENCWAYSGGRYILKLKQSQGVEWDIWISPEQMRAIHGEIKKATDGDPPREELQQWIDVFWDDVEDIIEDESEWHDEAEVCCADSELRRCWNEWNLVVESEDSTDSFPEIYRCILGLPEGATYGDAVRHITNQLAAAGEKVDGWKESLEGE